MSNYWRSLRDVLPYFLFKRLFGDRRSYGLVTQENDKDWIQWQSVLLDFYYTSQKSSVGAVVNNAGYRVLKSVDFAHKKVLEIGPGDIAYLEYVPDSNATFHLVDVHPDMLVRSAAKVRARGFSVETTQIDKSAKTLPFADNSFDIILSFFSLEHIYPLKPFLNECRRVLKPGGLVVGGIPCEGGIAWGLGRYLTTRRWFKRNTTIDPDKIICWEHPNFANDIMRDLRESFSEQKNYLWPLSFLPFRDLNLVETFILRK